MNHLDRRTDAAPPSWRALAAEHPDIAAAYDALSETCRQAGPLPADQVALVKLAISVGAGCQRTIHAHAKKALRDGASPEALRQVAMIALPTIGLPRALDARGWINESIIEVQAEAAMGVD